MKGSTPTGEKLTLRDVLDSRYLMIHEPAEMSELKKRGIPLHLDTVIEFHPVIYEAYMTVFDFELSLARDEGERTWVERRIKLVDNWLEDNLTPPHLAQVCLRLTEKFA